MYRHLLLLLDMLGYSYEIIEHKPHSTHGVDGKRLPFPTTYIYGTTDPDYSDKYQWDTSILTNPNGWKRDAVIRITGVPAGQNISDLDLSSLFLLADDETWPYVVALTSGRLN